jgi:hypothetical protein
LELEKFLKFFYRCIILDAQREFKSIWFGIKNRRRRRPMG